MKVKTSLVLGNKIEKTPVQRERQRVLDRIEEERDPDIKQELRQGNIVQRL